MAVERCDDAVAVEVLSVLADSGFVDLPAEDADVGVDFDVADAGVFFAADDGCCWLAVGVTFVAVLAAAGAGFWVVPPLLGFALSADFVVAAAGAVVVFFPSLELAAVGLFWTAGKVGAAACATGAGGAGVGASGSKVSMSSVDALDGGGATAAATGADGAGVFSGTVLEASGSKSIKTPPPPPPPALDAGAAAGCDVI